MPSFDGIVVPVDEADVIEVLEVVLVVVVVAVVVVVVVEVGLDVVVVVVKVWIGIGVGIVGLASSMTTQSSIQYGPYRGPL